MTDTLSVSVHTLQRVLELQNGEPLHFNFYKIKSKQSIKESARDMIRRYDKSLGTF